ncbi:hypothetical protein ACFLTK_05415, partial [Chloroflexota bacterium]
MNIYALIPLVAVIAYIPLLAVTISSRPWQRRHKYFAIFLVAAIMWSLSDFLWRSDYLQQYNLVLGRLILIMFMWMAVQFHCFISSFFAPGQGRWLPFAYTSLGVVIIIAALGYIPREVVVSESKLYPIYGNWILLIAIPLLTLGVRNIYVFGKRLRVLDNPVLYNQTFSLLLTVLVLIIFSFAALIPWGREYPVTHFSGIINAFILSYATVRHQLVDIKTVLRSGLAWISLGLIGAGSYGLLLVTLHSVLH